MPTLYLVPVDGVVDAEPVLGAARAAGVTVALARPFADDAITTADIHRAYAEDAVQVLLERVVGLVDSARGDAALVVVAGLAPATGPWAASLNRAAIKAVDGDVVVQAGSTPAEEVAAAVALYDLCRPRRLVGILAAAPITAPCGEVPVWTGAPPAAALQELVGARREARLSPAMFRAKLIRDAAAAGKRIVLPEGDEPRTVEAATICVARGIATPVLLAERAAVERVAAEMGLDLDGCEIVDPTAIASDYVDKLVELRAHKGMTPERAAETLKDHVWVGTMMMKMGHVDGLVSGAVHSTANTIRPSLQVIKTKPGCSLVSSIFFMCLEDQVVVFGDCAVNTNPTAEQLADIAIESGRTAKAFGIPPRVAMISYSTGDSGQGADVEAVREAVRLAIDKADTGMVIDGPLQYDAAAVPSVGAKKAPGSPVAGQATVYVFPDLNTGNCTYKAVQRAAEVIAIGPMLQGMAMPVNDLSRGALVEDIVFTIALTAIQAAS